MKREKSKQPNNDKNRCDYPEHVFVSIIELETSDFISSELRGCLFAFGGGNVCAVATWFLYSAAVAS
jgi:hypothetical protein